MTLFNFLSKQSTGNSWEAQQKKSSLENMEQAATNSQNPTTQAAIANAGGNVAAPTSQSQVVVPVVKSAVGEAETLEIHINTEGKTSEQTIVIGCESVYKAQNPNFTGNPLNVVYTGSPEANLYPLMVQEFATNTFTLAGVTVTTLSSESDTSGGENAKLQLASKWYQVAGNFDGSFITKPIDIEAGRDPYVQAGTNILYYSFVGNEGRLDALTSFVLRVLPNVKMKLRFSVVSRVIGRQS